MSGYGDHYCSTPRKSDNISAFLISSLMFVSLKLRLLLGKFLPESKMTGQCLTDITSPLPKNNRILSTNEYVLLIFAYKSNSQIYFVSRRIIYRPQCTSHPFAPSDDIQALASFISLLCNVREKLSRRPYHTHHQAQSGEGLAYQRAWYR